MGQDLPINYPPSTTLSALFFRAMENNLHKNVFLFGINYINL